MTELIPSKRVSAGNYLGVARAIREKTAVQSDVASTVEDIVETVRSGGDRAVFRYLKSLDGVESLPRELRVSRSEIESAVGSQPPELVKAFRASFSRVGRVQRSVLRRSFGAVRCRGFKIEVEPKPLLSVGCYVPGGRASYASTVIMTAGVAKLAGVGRVVLCTPAGKDGRVNPAVLTAASIAGVDEVYKVGGAHAIAALAYGTGSIQKVEKIVGPGGRYVSAAKRYVSRDVAVDFYAGPTEMVVLADGACSPAVAGWEIVGQAEHGEDTLCGLVTFSEEYASRVRRAVEDILPSVERRAYVEASLKGGFSAICTDEAVASSFVNELAPEHLSVMTRDPARAASRIRGAGLKLLGGNSPCAASDYLVGTDHVIPTAGLAATRGPLSVLDFAKLDWTVTGSRAGLRELLPELRTIAEAEGLPNHYLSARARFGRRA